MKSFTVSNRFKELYTYQLNDLFLISKIQASLIINKYLSLLIMNSTRKKNVLFVFWNKKQNKRKRELEFEINQVETNCVLFVFVEISTY